MPWRRNAACAAIRAGVGAAFLLSGAGKLLDAFSRPGVPDHLGLPDPMLAAFGTLLPFIEVGLGASLLVGLFRASGVVVTWALLVVLTFGMVLLTEDPSTVTAELFGVVAVGLLLWREAAGAFATDRFRVREELGPPPPRTTPLPPLPREPSRRWVTRPRPRSRARADELP